MSRISPADRRLVTAVGKKDASRVEAAIAEGANPNTHGDARPVLVIATRKHWTSGVELLLALGANVDQADRDGSTALHAAVQRNESAMVELLLKAGGNVHAIDFDGDTPLHYAVLNNAAPSVELLLQHGANQDAVGKYGHTPLQLAKSPGRSKPTKMAFENFTASQGPPNQPLATSLSVGACGQSDGHTIPVRRGQQRLTQGIGRPTTSQLSFHGLFSAVERLTLAPSTSHRPQTRAVDEQARPSHGKELVQGPMKQVEQLQQENLKSIFQQEKEDA